MKLKFKGSTSLPPEPEVELYFERGPGGSVYVKARIDDREVPASHLIKFERNGTLHRPAAVNPEFGFVLNSLGRIKETSWYGNHPDH